MKALVIGGNRFIGKYLVNSLLANRFKVTVLNRGNLKPSYNGPVDHIIADRTNAAQLESALKGQEFDVVFDLICVDLPSAVSAAKIFQGKTTKYFLMSSTFVYPYGQNLSEEQFDPSLYAIPSPDVKLSVTESRKAIEAVFAQSKNFKAIIARVPFVFGEGDSTNKLKKLVKMIMHKEEIYYPKKDLKLSAVLVDDLALAMVKLALSRFVGSINLASESPLVFAQMIKLIETASYRTGSFTEKPKETAMTLFSLKGDWYLDTSRMRSLDIQVKNTSVWLPKLIQKSVEEVEKEVAK